MRGIFWNGSLGIVAPGEQVGDMGRQAKGLPAERGVVGTRRKGREEY